MENSQKKWKWNCRNCGRSNATVPDMAGKVKCEYCTDVRSIRPRQPGIGETLRHWTTDSLQFVGARLQQRSESSGRDVADPCLVNLVAAKLKSIKAQPAG